MRWIPRVEKKSLAELEAPSKRWDDLDAVLAQAVAAVVTGPLKKDFLLYQQDRPRVGQALSGRAALWHLYQRFEVDHGAALAIDYQTLIGLQFNSDLAGVLASWDACFIRMSERPSDKMLWAILTNQLRSAPRSSQSSSTSTVLQSKL